MNRKGEEEFGGNILLETIFYVILFLVFFLFTLYRVLGYENGAALVEDFYAKEIARMINSAEYETKVCIDVTEASKIAVKRGQSLSDAFNFDNVNNEVIVSLRPSSGTAYGFFNDVDIVNKEYKELVRAEPVVNQLCFEIVEVRKT